MARVYHLTFRFVKFPTMESLDVLEKQFDEMGDWLRFNGLAWLLSSELNPTQIKDKLRLTLEPEDHFLVLEVNLTGADGWAVPWIWEWIRKKRG